jgi:hypothetical protein
MAESIALYPTKTRLALLADVAALRVADDPDGTPMLDCGPDGHARVADAIWQMYRAGWIEQPAGEVVWRLTPAGFDVLEERTP